MSYDSLDQMIMYIEDHLTEKINYRNLAKILGVSEYSMHRIFIFLTNISISEYIRKRKLSKAFEEIKNSNFKIIDIAYKYGYESSISFSRSFKQHFGITPSECKSCKKNYKLFPIMKFDNKNFMYKQYNYKIEIIDEKILFCFKVSANNEEDLLYKIRKLYSKIMGNGFYSIMNEKGIYGISLWNNNEYNYYIGSTVKFKNSEKFIIPKNKYVIFNVGSRNQKSIIEMENLIYDQLIKSTNYNIIDGFEFELYENDDCYLYVPVKDEQN